MTVYIGADHRGYALKEALKKWLFEQGHNVIDCGNTEYDKNDDYPDFALAVAENVAKDEGARGIIACGSGLGVTITANKVKGVYASLAHNPEEVAHATERDGLNVLALSGDYQSVEESQEQIKAFLEAKRQDEDRFVRRVQKIQQIEKKT